MPIAISPPSALVIPNGKVSFSVSGGTGPYVFSIPTNRSGGSINATTGAYLAGPRGLVVDVVRVTDSLAATSNANVTVTQGLWQKTQRGIVPPSMKLPNAQTVEGDFAGEKDFQFERARQGVRSNMPGYAPVDALDFIGQERQLPRATLLDGTPNETNALFGERLRTSFDDPKGWSPAGSHASLLYALDRAGFPMGDPSGAHIMQRWQRYSWLTASGGTPVYGTHPIWTFDGAAPRFWNEFGIIFGADVPTLTLGSSVAAALNQIVDDWRDRKARFMGTWIILSGPTWGWTVGSNWGAVGRTWGGGSTRFIPPL